jgi:uncharacterized protein
MILKLLIFAVAGIAIYKFFGGKFPSLTKSAEAKKLDDDTLVECATCSTYATVKESMIVNAKYYCSDECANS